MHSCCRMRIPLIAAAAPAPRSDSHPPIYLSERAILLVRRWGSSMASPSRATPKLSQSRYRKKRHDQSCPARARATKMSIAAMSAVAHQPVHRAGKPEILWTMIARAKQKGMVTGASGGGPALRVRSRQSDATASTASDDKLRFEVGSHPWLRGRPARRARLAAPRSTCCRRVRACFAAFSAAKAVMETLNCSLRSRVPK
jgi:hypothetical protein